MGFPLAPAAITPFDNLDNLGVIVGLGTATIRTINGKGSADVVLKGDGDVDVSMKYSVDGGADTLIGLANAPAYIALSFQTSLVLKAVNANVAAKNYSGVSSTGVKQ
jgi:hypothetical protein